MAFATWKPLLDYLLASLHDHWKLPGCPIIIFSRVMLSRISSTLPLLLGRTLRVSVDACSLSNCFTVVVLRSVVGEAGKCVRNLGFSSFTDIPQARERNMRHCNGRSWHLVHALHRVRLPSNLSHYYSTDSEIAIALSPLAMDVIHCNLPTPQDSQRFPYSCL